MKCILIVLSEKQDPNKCFLGYFKMARTYKSAHMRTQFLAYDTPVYKYEFYFVVLDWHLVAGTFYLHFYITQI